MPAFWPLITGPTASGKTALALELAQRLEADILSCDAMQIYRGMDIGTAKASDEEQRTTRHHLIDVADVHERFTVNQWYQLAKPILDMSLDTGAGLVACGGTPQYVTALMEGHIPGTLPQDLSLRQSLRAEAERKGEEGWIELHQSLERFDPEKFHKYHHNDHRRVLRAHEIYRITGRSQTELERQEKAEVVFPFKAYAIAWPREQLYERINLRVEGMLQEGLLDEFRALHWETIPEHATARQAIGYKELHDYFEGKCTLDDAIDLIKMNSRRYAKRQLSWFRQKPWLTWLELEDNARWVELVLEDLAG